MIPDFVNTWAGAVVLTVIGLASLLNVYSDWIDDGFFGRVLYMSTAFTCMCGLIGFFTAQRYLPENITPTLLTLFSCLAVRNVLVRLSRYIKMRKYYAQRK